MPDEKNMLPLKERMKIPRVHMPEIDLEARTSTFKEVGLGLAEADAATEASRCIACAKPGCQMQCPVGTDIKAVAALICAGDYLAAAAKIREKNCLPAVTSRVLPQENQCEGGCALGKKGEPMAIGNLERFIADFERASGQLGLPAIAPSTARVWPSSAAVSRAQHRRRPGAKRSSRACLWGPSRTRRRASLWHSEFRLPKSIVKGEWTTCARWVWSLRPTCW